LRNSNQKSEMKRTFSVAGAQSSRAIARTANRPKSALRNLFEISVLRPQISKKSNSDEGKSVPSLNLRASFFKAIQLSPPSRSGYRPASSEICNSKFHIRNSRRVAG